MAHFDLYTSHLRASECSVDHSRVTVEPPKTDTPRDEPKCPSYKGIRLVEVFHKSHMI